VSFDNIPAIFRGLFSDSDSADIMRAMRRLACVFLILMSLLQWSWAGVHEAAEAANAVSHTLMAQDGGASAPEHGQDEPSTECSAQFHCCHPHSAGVPGEFSAAYFSSMGMAIAEHIALRPPEISFNDIERPKWLPASMAVAVL
jgi:hypothetical protein